ncbi:LEAF RUST 10 DISEASE-RESISTANCE LOCUS RECEPTOR-LIKE PROTEIN KINASE-like 2.1 [Tripterygium wilfordii]|uniref:LEAF RUST 10 DISEASE-RESISTANCE LOCUS RECEPTOR-LIKE PROTEIN KINASE-like 2.1 n=1 Tax=Tripterygium wilfordii TaxID=458696 RepID=UPI0018F844D7|nr:LEAF RUST 10 DISEASE-RESISTANCE LOCUS RECEPTOR-LIKE PROTEIN KINASE-like 2.1 [Tripterygium wilfordii]
MTLRDPILLLLALSVFSLNRVVHASTKCNRRCGNNEVFYPFGFSDGCQIRLNCTEKGERVINGFTVQSLTTDSIKVAIGAQCYRSPSILHNLYTQNYAPTNSNAILLHSCSSTAMLCVLPSIDIKTRFEGLDCDSNNSSNISCYSDSGSSGFLNYDSMTQIGCQYLLSVIATQDVDPHSFNDSGVSMALRVVELGWWLEGNCDCSANACILLRTPSGRSGYRCQCKEGYEGDGYPGSTGCRIKDGSKRKLKLRIGIGATFLGSIGIISTVILICSIVFCIKRKMLSNKDDQELEAIINDFGPLPLKRYSFSYIKKITCSLKDRLGEGGYGCVYKGKLLDGCLVAVKVLNNTKGNGQDFMNEVLSISRTSHVNIVTLLGFCLEGSKRALIYEFVSNGSLEKFIYNKSNTNTNHHFLGWESMYRIAVEIAQGLEYLHRGCKTRILHFDIKPHNILLDEDFCPKISDFGLAKLCIKKESIVSILEARGTIGYIAPELFSRNFGGVSHKSDVYSYGMMILEMVGARNNTNIKGENSSETYFPHWIYKRLEEENYFRLNDCAMTELENEAARKMVLVGLWCIQTDPSQRPNISEVLDMLKGSIDKFQIPPRPFVASPARSLLLESCSSSIL